MMQTELKQVILFPVASVLYIVRSEGGRGKKV